jgi:ABC-type branched-subunit amino acid transport system substrate-binding protein
MSDNKKPQAAAPPRQLFPPGVSYIGLAVALLAVLAVSAFSMAPRFRTQDVATKTTVGGGPSGAPGVSATAGVGGPAGSGVAGAAGGASAALGQLSCAAGKNGGSTDTGVSDSSIKLASTVVESGIGQSFLGEVRLGMIAVVNQVNAAGGVCGRRLDLANGLVDDGWQPAQGQQDIRNFIAEGVFAMPVVPSSEGLNAASGAGDIDRAGLPVVGTDGMLFSQYSDPWIWPVSTSTISTAHIAVKHAYGNGARSFGIVWDRSYKFGTEGEQAFKGAISRLPGATIKADVGIDAGQQDYSRDGASLNNGCGGGNGVSGCDMIFVLLEPSTAETWFSTSGMNRAAKYTEGPQPLFVDTFGQNCGAACNNMIVWSSYFPPRQPFAGTAAVSGYVNAIRSVSASADIDNQFLEGGYDGMLLFVEALKKTGPNLTRAGLKKTLDGTTFDSGLSRPLTWRSGNHYANTAMLGFSIQYSQGFNGFQYLQTDWVADPWVGQDHP